jgi:hypothetical protein
MRYVFLIFILLNAKFSCESNPVDSHSEDTASTDTTSYTDTAKLSATGATLNPVFFQRTDTLLKVNDTI